MVKVSKVKMGKREITVTEHFPDDPEDMNFIRETLARFTIDTLRTKFSEESLNIAIPIYERMKELQSEGYSYEESKEKAKKEFENNEIEPIA